MGKNKFDEQKISLIELENQVNKSGNAINYWIKKMRNPGNFIKRFLKI